MLENIGLKSIKKNSKKLNKKEKEMQNLLRKINLKKILIENKKIINIIRKFLKMKNLFKSVFLNQLVSI